MKRTGRKDLPLALNSVFATGSRVLDGVFADILLCPVALLVGFIVGPFGDPRANVIGAFAADLAVFKRQIKMHPPTIRTMPFDVKAVPLTRHKIAFHSVFPIEQV